MHELEQGTAAAVQTSQRLQRQRANLVATLDALRAMEGVAQVCPASIASWDFWQAALAGGALRWQDGSTSASTSTSPTPSCACLTCHLLQAQSALQGLLPRAGGVAADYAGAIDVLEVLQGVLDDEALLALDCFK